MIYAPLSGSSDHGVFAQGLQAHLSNADLCTPSVSDPFSHPLVSLSLGSELSILPLSR